MRNKRRHTGLRSTDYHGSWREVYSRLDVDTTIEEVTHAGQK